jgi:hypothetical protein
MVVEASGKADNLEYGTLRRCRAHSIRTFDIQFSVSTILFVAPIYALATTEELSSRCISH